MAKEVEAIEPQDEAKLQVEVAKEVEVEKEVEAETKGAHYYRSKIAGLSVVSEDITSKDPTMIKKERFTAYVEKVEGDTTKVGYLKTSTKRVIDALKGDGNVTEIDKKEYDEATGAKAKRAR